MSLSRRRFLEIGSIVAASSAIPLQASTASSQAVSTSSRTSFHSLSFEESRALAGERFFVEAGLGRPLQMELASVESLPQHDDRACGEAFLLNFRLKRGASIPQGTYQFEHATVGQFSLLITPSGLNKGHYAAVINHRRPA